MDAATKTKDVAVTGFEYSKEKTVAATEYTKAKVHGI